MVSSCLLWGNSCFWLVGVCYCDLTWVFCFLILDVRTCILNLDFSIGIISEAVMALWWIGTIGFYVHVTFNVYWPYCYFVVRGTVVTSGRSTFILLLLLWELGFCGITFEFLGWLMRPGRR